MVQVALDKFSAGRREELQLHRVVPGGPCKCKLSGGPPIEFHVPLYDRLASVYATRAASQETLRVALDARRKHREQMAGHEVRMAEVKLDPEQRELRRG